MKWRNWLIGGAVVLACLVSAYVWVQLHLEEGEVFAWKAYGKTLVIITIIAAVLLALTFFAWKYFTRNEGLDLEKKPVDASDAVRAWTEGFIEETNVPRNYVKGKPVPVPDLIQVRNADGFFNERTGSHLYRFDVDVRGGSMPGTHTVVTLLDKGEDWIRNNWQWTFHTNRTKESFDRDEKALPYASVQDAKERETLLKIDAVESGADREELERITAQYSPIEKPEFVEEDAE